MCVLFSYFVVPEHAAAGPVRHRAAATVPSEALRDDPAVDGNRIANGADEIVIERGDALHQWHAIGQIAARDGETAGIRRQLGEHEVAARWFDMAEPVEAEGCARAGVPDEARRRIGKRREAERREPEEHEGEHGARAATPADRKSTRLNSSH